jgi:hypothetical protein
MYLIEEGRVIDELNGTELTKKMSAVEALLGV